MITRTEILVLCVVGVSALLFGMWLHSLYYRHAKGNPMRLLARRAVYFAVEWFFAHVIKIRPNRFLEYISAMGLIALLVGKIVIVVMGYLWDYGVVTSGIAASAAVAGIWQFRAVNHSTSYRRHAAQAAVAAWSFIVFLLMAQFVATAEYTLARMILEFVIPLSSVFWMCAFVQMWVLLRYELYPEKHHPEIAFFYAVWAKIEAEVHEVFKVPNEVKVLINEHVRTTAEERGIVRKQ